MKIDRVFVDVDVQNDFCLETGSLYVKGSPNDLYRRLTAHAVARGIPILGSVDSHAWDAWEFGSNDVPPPEDATKPNFPDHCVKGTPGWLKVEGTLPPRFRFLPNVPEAPLASVALDELLQGKTQGVYFEKEVYSLFINPLADPFVRDLVAATETPPEFFVYGVATDYCVRAAALGLAERGYRTALIEDAVAGISPEGVARTFDELRSAGVRITRSTEILG
ncbi:cysteine hydrolase family protein [Chondromyces crocatus]|uniref:nicotinamidase n=1 Tax=Chondromyces crocatus TaxID=52 RepID=A0A0K1EJJ9_CHOCO|nr:isochorismatase family protein [Chondromyces crocatus]AKT40763.1 isochorismatase [Chondromyces crocatus]